MFVIRILTSFVILSIFTPKAYGVAYISRSNFMKCHVSVGKGESWINSETISKRVSTEDGQDFTGALTVGKNIYEWNVTFRNGEANTFIQEKSTSSRVALARFAVPRGGIPEEGIDMMTLSVSPDFENVRVSCSRTR